MRKQKPISAHSVRGETSKKHVYGERYNVDAGSSRVKTSSGKIPKTPAEKIDLDAE